MSTLVAQKRLALAGAAFGCALFLFIDGWIIARGTPNPFNFLTCVPLILAACGAFLQMFADPDHIFYRVEEDEEDAAIISKAFFFVGSIFLFAAVATSIWVFIDPYSSSDKPWCGVAVILSTLCLTACGYTVFMTRHHSEEDYY